MNTITENSMVKNLLDKYIERGFGSMNKTDFEVLFMNILLKDRLKGKSNYDISRELRIPEARVKTLIYQASLKYDNGETAQRERLISVLNKVTLYHDSNEVSFFVEDISTRNYLFSLLNKKGKTADYKNNRDIVVLHLVDFVSLLDNLYSEEEKEKIKFVILTVINNKVDASTRQEKTFKQHMNDLLKMILEKGKDKVADLSVEGIIKSILKLAPMLFS